MEIRDPVHGSIHILDEEIPIIEAEFFQRLRNIKQLGFAEYIFPALPYYPVAYESLSQQLQ